MRDYRSIEQVKAKVETKNMDIPTSSCRVRQTRRKRRTRPAADRFHGEYFCTNLCYNNRPVEKIILYSSSLHNNKIPH